MEFENILYEVRDGILYLTLNRPEVRNALSPEMWRDISAAVRQARLDDAVQVVVVTGAGDKALASGADIQELHDRYYMDQMIGTATTALKDLEDLYKPVICAVNGYALGGGCELAEACDIRVATRRSKFGQPEINLSIIPGAGGTQRLTRLVGISKAKELIYTGKIITAEEAQAIGLVNIVTDDSREDVRGGKAGPADNVQGPPGTDAGQNRRQLRSGDGYQHRLDDRAAGPDHRFQHRGSERGHCGLPGKEKRPFHRAISAGKINFPF